MKMPLIKSEMPELSVVSLSTVGELRESAINREEMNIHETISGSLI